MQIRTCINYVLYIISLLSLYFLRGKRVNSEIKPVTQLIDIFHRDGFTFVKKVGLKVYL
jgi:hypothetical protein